MQSHMCDCDHWQVGAFFLFLYLDFIGSSITFVAMGEMMGLVDEKVSLALGSLRFQWLQWIECCFAVSKVLIFLRACDHAPPAPLDSPNGQTKHVPGLA